MRSITGNRTSASEKPERRYDIDWIRIFGMATIFLYHCGRFFNLEDWHVKNNALSPGISIILEILEIWMMPLFFMISSMSSYYSLTKRSQKQYILERFKRLIIPLIFGTLVIIVPVQVYIERASHGQFKGSFIDFYPHYFDGLYAFGGNFAWMGLHLWYLEFLFIFSMLTLPLFVLGVKKKNSRAISHAVTFFTKPGAIFLLAIPLILMEMFVGQYRDSIGIQSFGGWSLLTYLLFFITGFFLSLDVRFKDTIEKHRIPALLIAAGITLLGIVSYLYDLESVGKYQDVLTAAASWCWLLAIFGFGSRHLSFNHSILKYANEAVLPFYILHQMVIVIFGFWMMDWEIGILAKYLLLSLSSFLTIMLVYEFLIRRINLMRFLFGMK
jgi:hypothetical protein